MNNQEEQTAICPQCESTKIVSEGGKAIDDPRMGGVDLEYLSCSNCGFNWIEV